MHRNRFVLVIWTVAVTVLLSSCGPRDIGTAVVLWPPDGSTISAGSMLPVVSQSERTGDYTLRTGEKGQTVTVPEWRVAFYEDSNAARKRAEAYADYKDMFARSELTALPVRKEQDRMSDLVYRLRDGEVMKVLDRSAEQSNEAGYVAYWYHVLTRDGTEGWVFGYYLTVYRSDGTILHSPNTQTQDKALDAFLQSTWRPDYFAEMLASGHINLQTFKPEYGLFPDPEHNQIRLSLPDQNILFDYTDIVNVAPKQYMAEGSSLQIILRDEKSASIRYTLNGQGHSLAIQTLDVDLQKVIDQEKARRQAKLEELYTRGPVLTSSAYGTVSVYEDGSFRWTGYQSLVPSVIPRNAGSDGTLSFRLFLSKQLEGNFDGVISLHFSNMPEDTYVDFLYQYRNSGVRLVSVSAENVQDNVVLQEGLSPIVVFMSFQSSSGIQ